MTHLIQPSRVAPKRIYPIRHLTHLCGHASQELCHVQRFHSKEISRYFRAGHLDRPRLRAVAWLSLEAWRLNSYRVCCHASLPFDRQIFANFANSVIGTRCFHRIDYRSLRPPHCFEWLNTQVHASTAESILEVQNADKRMSWASRSNIIRRSTLWDLTEVLQSLQLRWMVFPK